jgi:thiamine biosynthesis lipoprotein
VIALLVVALLEAPARESRALMGTTAEIWVKGPADRAGALDAAFAALARAEELTSAAKENELARLNRSGEASISADLLSVVRQALELCVASKGAFDPTLAPKLSPAASSVERVHLDAATGRVRLEPGTVLDLRGVARGFAGDRALAVLKNAGATSALVDLGGSLAVFGEPLDLVVHNPEISGGPPWATYRVREGHVATLGLEKTDATLGRRTGAAGASGRALSVTVVAASGLEAEALSSAVSVLGAKAGLELLAERGAAGFVLLRERGRAVLWTTPGFSDSYDLEASTGVLVRE